MRTGPITVIQALPAPSGSINDIYVINVPMMQLVYPLEMPRPSIEQVAALGGHIQSAIDQAIANFEMHWRSVARGPVQ